ncbi:MAG: serine/threonine protein kinase [Gammaproteobacteria bacterium]|nr:serine/threonine protein kinase [Gammaproteobacteria bacterium]
MPASSAAILGSTVLLPGTPPRACRDTAAARWWARPLSRWLAAREARALRALNGLDGVPTLLDWDGRRLLRTVVAGHTMCAARPGEAAYFRDARRLLARVHRRGIAHNDLAREPNWLVQPDGRAGLIDFQLAWHDARRGAWFRLLAREDLRHLLKHKRSYCPQHLTARERRLLATPSAGARVWRWTLHPLGRTLRRWLAPS